MKRQVLLRRIKREARGASENGGEYSIRETWKSPRACLTSKVSMTSVGFAIGHEALDPTTSRRTNQPSNSQQSLLRSFNKASSVKKGILPSLSLSLSLSLSHVLSLLSTFAAFTKSSSLLPTNFANFYSTSDLEAYRIIDICSSIVVNFIIHCHVCTVITGGEYNDFKITMVFTVCVYECKNEVGLI